MGITYLVGNIRFKTFISWSLAEEDYEMPPNIEGIKVDANIWDIFGASYVSPGVLQNHGSQRVNNLFRFL